MRFAYPEMGVRHTCHSPRYSNRHWSLKRHSEVALATNVCVMLSQLLETPLSAVESRFLTTKSSTLRCTALAFEEFYYGLYLHAAFLTSLTIVGGTFQVFVGEARGRKLVVMPGFEPGQERSVAQTAKSRTTEQHSQYHCHCPCTRKCKRSLNEFTVRETCTADSSPTDCFSS
jgi:hypothetical protein